MISDSNIRVERIDDETRFQASRDDWNTLATQASRDSVFLRHEWFDATWQWRKADSTLHIFCVRRGGKLIGICPLVARKSRRYGIPVRVVEFLTVPDTQFCDVLATSHDRALVIDAVIGALARSSRGWDMLELELIPINSPTHGVLAASLNQHGMRNSPTPVQTNPFVNLTNGWAHFYAQRSRRLKKSNNWVANRLGRTGKSVTLKWVRGGGQNRVEFNHAMETAIGISARSWKQETGLTLDRPGPNAFFRRIVQHAADNGWLSLWIMSLDSVPVATEFQIIHAEQVHALRADFDKAFHELSVGSYLNWKQLEKLFSANLQRYWMGPGENPYKSHWTEETEPLGGYMIYSNTWRARLLYLINARLRPVLKQLIRRRGTTPTPGGDIAA